MIFTVLQTDFTSSYEVLVHFKIFIATVLSVASKTWVPREIWEGRYGQV